MEIFNDHVVWTLSDKQEIILSAWLLIDDIHPLDLPNQYIKTLYQTLNWKLKWKSNPDS